MIYLYINGSMVDLPDGGISILFQRQRTDYTNPTIVRNSFTKTIKLPGTKVNDVVFANFWNLDRLTPNSFNPSKRVPFHLMIDNSTLVEQGYIKLNNIVDDGNFHSYEVTLYGELGNLLYGLSYSINNDTEEVRPLTFADLDFGFNQFIINKDLIKAAWGRLDGDSDYSGDAFDIFDTINFMVSYDGVPAANNFDPKSMWCSVDRQAAVYWKDVFYNYGSFPSSITEDGVTYSAFSTMLSQIDPNDNYALMDLKKEMSILEARDLRSYLLRPVVKISKIFDAISDYIEEHFGYTLDISDPFFSTDEFRSTWMTLSMLYEIDPEVQTGSIFTKNQLFSNTSTPASYLISYCKIYGIYLDVDYFRKKLVLTRLPNFFNGERKNVLKIDKSKEIKINPLSFDKATYTFDYSDGDGEFYKKYQDTYGLKYGSKMVNTGYRFDASTAPYIDNNVFRGGVDSIDQSSYYRYPYFVEGGNLFVYPTAVMDDASLPTYKLFDIQTYRQTGEVKTYDGDMKAYWFPYDNNNVYSLNGGGYQYINRDWAGLRPGVWQDGFPKVQLRSSDNKGVDGKDILVRFNGFMETSYGKMNQTADRTYWTDYSTTGYEKVNYLLSDDYKWLKDVIGKNCYYDNPNPDISPFISYIEVINRIPSFTRGDYSYSVDTDKIPGFYVSGFTGYNISTTADATVLKYDTYYVTNVGPSSGRVYAYFTNSNIKANHRYFIAAAVKSNNATLIRTDNNYAHPDILDSTLIDSEELGYGIDSVQFIGSIVETGDDPSDRVIALSTYDVSDSVTWETYYLVVYDLTETGVAGFISTVSDAMTYFGIDSRRAGFEYNLDDILDFGVSREMYVPFCSYDQNIGVYNKYWRRYISDVYSINTRVMDCYCFLDNIDEVFREFYYYDNCLWILSKITDWNLETKYCKATFVRVMNISKYTS